MWKKFSWKERLYYKIDSVFSKGTGITVFWLMVGSLFLVVLFSLFMVIFNVTPSGKETAPFLESFWINLLHTLDASALAEGDGWFYRFFMLIVTLTGVFVISTLIGVVSTGLEVRLDLLQRGRSKVIEFNHTVILGWSEQVFTIVEELSIANENQNDGCIVIMGNKDKVAMEEEFREKIPNARNTRLVCRTGSPVEPSSLEILSLNTAKSIIVLSPDCDDPDSEVIKICLAIIQQAARSATPFHIVAELRNAKNLDIGRIVGKKEVEWILSEDIISRMIAQTCHQSGLSTIYTDLMDFAGDEIYFFTHPSFSGKTFGNLLNNFKKNAVMGMWKKGSHPELNPKMDTQFEDGDQLFLLAEDDDKIFLHDFDRSIINEELIQNFEIKTHEPEKILIIGWNSRASKIVNEMDHYILPNSELTIVADKALVNDSPMWNNLTIKNADIKFIFGNTSDRDFLKSLTPHHYQHIILLSYGGSLSTQASDAKTLITLLHLRDIADKCDQCQFSIVTEMLDVRNRDLAEVTKADDFIVSERFISLLLSQVSESKLLNLVFEDILDAKGSEVYLKPAQNYVILGQKVNFYTVVESARRKNEVAIGYKIGAYYKDPERDYGIVLNPNKTEYWSYNEDDQIIILSETF